MDLFRSEPMQLTRVIIPVESAHRVISYLGELGLFQFKDVCFIIIIIYLQHQFDIYYAYLFRALVIVSVSFSKSEGVMNLIYLVITHYISSFID